MTAMNGALMSPTEKVWIAMAFCSRAMNTAGVMPA